MMLSAAFILLLGGALPLRAQTEEAGAERTLTLEDAERLASLNNATLLSAEQGIVVAQQRVQEAKSLFLPEVGLQASGTRYDARYPFALAPELHSILLFPSAFDNIYSGRAYLTQTVYDGGKTVNLLRLAQSTLRQAQTQYEAAKMDTVYWTKRVFYRLILAQETLASTRRRLNLAKQELALRRFSGWERVEAEAIVSELRVRESSALHDVDMAGLEFRRALNLELDTPVRVIGSLETKRVNVDLNKAVVWAMELRPELQSEIFKAQMEDIAVNLAASRRFPTLILAGNYEITGQEFPLRQNNWDATLGLKIPIPFDFWTQLRQKHAEKRQGEIMRADLQDRVRLEVRQAYEELEFWQKEWPQRESEYTRLNTLSQSAGGKGGLEFLRAQTALLDAQERYLDSVSEHVLSLAKIERAVGRPLTP